MIKDKLWNVKQNYKDVQENAILINLIGVVFLANSFTQFGRIQLLFYLVGFIKLYDIIHNSAVMELNIHFRIISHIRHISL